MLLYEWKPISNRKIQDKYSTKFRPVEPAALHAAAKNIIYFTALAVLRGRPLSAYSTAAAVDR